ncbi:CbiX/SirB N-terminal domain-containing protein [Halomonas sabkhae]|uniref:sirohydrochlorin chelatase n=1 Tax=Halomonas sabkhae TaxID=626223 RepID=UPI0025B3C375|nr:CbiX/SirB N-terminal domain-containing protein [Halomonas sabkhae]MDN3525127.1 CbiX/SirB N-terminal domain-containing protein [Halomonas sabkhae]
MNKALILMAHGSSDPRWREPFERVHQAAAERLSQPLRLAYMELCDPSLEDTVAELAEAGIEHADILPLFFAAGRHLRKDVPAQVDALETQHPSISLSLLSPVGEHPDFIAALAGVIAERDAS